MSGLEKRASNTDILGKSWLLAPGGFHQVERSKTTLWKLSHELKALAGLFRSAGHDTVLDQEELYGLGISLGRISGRLRKIERRLELALTQNGGADEQAR